MKTWDEWSDFEINKAVASVLGVIINDDCCLHELLK